MLGYLSGFDNDLLNLLERQRRLMDQVFAERSAPLGIRSGTFGAYPPINVGASARQVDVYVFATGLDPKNLDISLQQNLLTVSGERRADIPEAAQTYRQERFRGDFRRAITLPEDVDPDQVNATYREGVLHITVQRRQEVQPRKIEVK